MYESLFPGGLVGVVPAPHYCRDRYHFPGSLRCLCLPSCQVRYACSVQGSFLCCCPPCPSLSFLCCCWCGRGLPIKPWMGWGEYQPELRQSLTPLLGWCLTLMTALSGSRVSPMDTMLSVAEQTWSSLALFPLLAKAS